VAVGEEFSSRGDELKLIASAIRAAAGDQASIALAELDEGITEAVEGRSLTRLHRVRERSRELVKRKRDLVLRETGSLACAACGFDFNDRYGEHGRGFIEVHHLLPLHALAPGSHSKRGDAWRLISILSSFRKASISTLRQSHGGERPHDWLNHPISTAAIFG
jgi:5-methylcytosine-specific restriction enzyme A